MEQVRRNWFIPIKFTSKQGQVVVVCSIGKDGRITGVSIKEPSAVADFNASALRAITDSNPTLPLPPEYRGESAPVTVTFYFNQSPPRTK